MSAHVKHPLPASVLLSSCLCLSLPAAADLDANIGAVSEYVREGISQTRGNLTWQTGLTWQHSSGVYLGGWASGLDRRSDNADFEADAFAGLYLPFSENIAVDLSATHYRFYGDTLAEQQDYNEFGLSLLLDDSWSFGWRHSPDYLGSGKARRALDASYTLHTSSFDIEFYAANYRWLETDASLGHAYSDNGASNYWHFRLGAERSWKQWDYRLTVERTNLGGEYDAGTLIQFGLHRYFNIW